MTPIVVDIALAVGSSMAVSIIAKVTVTMALTLFAVRLERRSCAAVRHALLAAAFAISLALPMASIFVPTARFVRVPIVASKVVESHALPSITGFSSRAGNPTTVVSVGQARITSSRLPVTVLLFAGWATGALLSLLPVLIGLWQVRRSHHLGRPWQHGQSLLQEVATDTGITHRRVEVLLHEAISGPVSYGVLRPAIVLPMDAPTWQEDNLRRAIIHELEHVRRGDWVSQCLARMVCACYWFHPLVWIAWRQLVLEAERTCDDAVLQWADATDYADQLVVLAKRISATHNRAMLTMTNRRDLAARVASVLDSRQQRGRAGTFFIAAVWIASALLIATISPLRVAVAQSQASTQTFSGSLTDPLGRTLPDTRLTLWNTSTQQPFEARSDQAGHFAFSGIPVGGYLLKVHEFGPQERITVALGQHLNRDIAVVMDGIDDTVTIRSSDPVVVLPALPRPLLPPSRASQPYADQADLSRCAQVSMFCRVTPPIQIARAQPAYPAKQRENGVAGTVVIEGRVATDGLVKDLHVLPPADPDFASATAEALRRWQFTPIRLDDVPVEMSIRVTAHFVLQ